MNNENVDELQQCWQVHCPLFQTHHLRSSVPFQIIFEKSCAEVDDTDYLQAYDSDHDPKFRGITDNARLLRAHTDHSVIEKSCNRQYYQQKIAVKVDLANSLDAIDATVALDIVLICIIRLWLIPSCLLQIQYLFHLSFCLIFDQC